MNGSQARPETALFIVLGQFSAVDPLLVNLYTARSVAPLGLYSGVSGLAQNTGFSRNYA